MDKNSMYYKQVQLLVQTLPLLFDSNLFALKGGTAINLFVRDLPRLSVDIDLVYLGDEGREEALYRVREELDKITSRVLQRLMGSSVQKSYESKPDALRLVISRMGVSIKVELSPVFRGTIFPVRQMPICELGEEEFGFVEIPVVSLGDLYGGKICAALDRQHPRDLYDVLLLTQNEGITEEIRKSTIAYLLSHRKPLSDLLNPKFKDIERTFEKEFKGMSREAVSIDELLEIQHSLPELILGFLTSDEKDFLLSFKSLNPDWLKLGIENAKNLPAIRWKLKNIEKMTEVKRVSFVEKLKDILIKK